MQFTALSTLTALALAAFAVAVPTGGDPLNQCNTGLRAMLQQHAEREPACFVEVPRPHKCRRRRCHRPSWGGLQPHHCRWHCRKLLVRLSAFYCVKCC